MKVSDWIALSSMIVSLLGVIITAYFSYIVAKISKRSADTADNALKLSETMLNKQEQEHTNLRIASHMKVMKAVKQLWAGLSVYEKPSKFAFVDEKDFFSRIQRLPRKADIEEDKLLMYFNETQRQIIENIFFEFETYLERNWLLSDGTFRNSFLEEEFNKLFTNTKQLSKNVHRYMRMLEKEFNLVGFYS